MSITKTPAGKPVDRRVLRTRRMLRDALISLILERGYDDLSIQDITDRADLRRATFYLHYRDKEELLQAVLTDLFASLMEEANPVLKGDILGGKTRVDAFLITFRHVADHARLYRMILNGHAGAQVAQFIRHYLAAHVRSGLETAAPGQLRLPIDVLANYIAGAEFSFIVWWLESGQPYPAEEMASMAHRLILEGVLPMVGSRNLT